MKVDKMRDLTFDEIEFVAGGISVTPPEQKSWSEWVAELASNIYDAIFGDHSGSSGSSNMPHITASDLGQMQRDCLAAGGSFSFDLNGNSAGASMTVVDVNGNESYAHITCSAP